MVPSKPITYKFGPHGTIGLFLTISIASLGEKCTKMNRIKFANLKSIFKLPSLHLSASSVLMTGTQEARRAGSHPKRKVQSSPEVQR
jgi:hypothetical protein